MWICRILSGVDVSIYFQIGSKIRLLLHLFDLELFRAIWIFKAFPQTLIQFYVTKTNTINVLVLFSVVWSLWSIISLNDNEYLTDGMKNSAEYLKKN